MPTINTNPFRVTFRFHPDPNKVARVLYGDLPDAIKKRVVASLARFAFDVKRALAKKLDGSASGWPANNPLWKAAKGGKGVLYNTGADLVPKIRSLVRKGKGQNYGSVEVGWSGNVQTNETYSQKTDKQVAVILNRGRTWQPSAKQRRAFWARIPKEDKPSRWEDTGVEKKQYWQIPPRPFIPQVQNDPVLRAKYVRIMRNAAQRAAAEIAAKASKLG